MYGMAVAAGGAGDRGAAIPPELADRFQAVRELGRGAFGRVVLAREAGLDRQVALKFLDAAIDDASIRDRFRREAEVTSRLEHPHVVRVHDCGFSGEGEPWIAYEWIDGEALDRIMERAGGAREDDLFRWAGELASALAAAHEKGIVHRDVKPANVLVRKSGEAVLVDFGIARLEAASRVLTREGAILGTPAYMAPEVLKGQEPGPASDQFSLAALVYEGLVGEPVWGRGTIRELVDRILSGVAPRVPRGVAGRRPAAAAVLDRALAMDPGERYPEVAGFGAALAAAAAPEGEGTPVGRATLSGETRSLGGSEGGGETRRLERVPSTAVRGGPVGTGARVAGPEEPGNPRPGLGARVALAGLLGLGVAIGWHSGTPTGAPTGGASGPGRAMVRPRIRIAPAAMLEHRGDAVGEVLSIHRERDHDEWLELLRGDPGATLPELARVVGAWDRGEAAVSALLADRGQSRDRRLDLLMAVCERHAFTEVVRVRDGRGIEPRFGLEPGCRQVFRGALEGARFVRRLRPIHSPRQRSAFDPSRKAWRLVDQNTFGIELVPEGPLPTDRLQLQWPKDLPELGRTVVIAAALAAWPTDELVEISQVGPEGERPWLLLAPRRFGAAKTAAFSAWTGLAIPADLLPEPGQELVLRMRNAISLTTFRGWTSGLGIFAIGSGADSPPSPGDDEESPADETDEPDSRDPE